MGMATHSAMTTARRNLSHGFCSRWIGPRMRSRKSYGIVAGDDVGRRGGRGAPVSISSTQAPGQSKVPAVRKRMAPSSTRR